MKINGVSDFKTWGEPLEFQVKVRIVVNKMNNLVRV